LFNLRKVGRGQVRDDAFDFHSILLPKPA
jgi:hypothetical protein